MIWFIIGQLFSTLVSFVHASRLSVSDKDLEIAMLRHQLDVMVRLQKRPIKANQETENLVLSIKQP